jgi:hypothetical protein
MIYHVIYYYVSSMLRVVNTRKEVSKQSNQNSILDRIV